MEKESIKVFVNKKDIVELYGKSLYEAGCLIALAKHVLCEKGYLYYANKRLGTVPHVIIKEILGIENN